MSDVWEREQPRISMMLPVWDKSCPTSFLGTEVLLSWKGVITHQGEGR